MNKRILSPYEKTQLARHGLDESSISQHQPIEHVTGFADFCGLQFAVNPDVLIPRVETEGLVELSLQAIHEHSTNNEAPLSIVEVGTGSGAVIISIAKHLLESKLKYSLYAGDISDSALAVAQQNRQNLLPNAPIEIKKSDLLSSFDEDFNIIVANLPYIPSARLDQLDSSVVDYEPMLALDGGKSGFEIIRRLLDQSRHKLTPDGSILLEIDHTHDLSFFEPYRHHFSISFFTDCFDRHRFARLDLKNSQR